MNNNFELLNNLLSNYLSVHDLLLNRRVRLTEEIEYGTLSTKLTSVQEGLHKLKIVFFEDRELTGNEKETISNYITELDKAVMQLQRIVEGLNMKATRTGRYGMARYSKDMKAYRKLIPKYMQYGEELNIIHQKHS